MKDRKGVLGMTATPNGAHAARANGLADGHVEPPVLGGRDITGYNAFVPQPVGS